MCSRTEKYGIPRKTKTKYINEKIVITRRSCFVFFMFSVLGVRRRSFRIWKNDINVNCRNGVSYWFKVKVETTNLTTTLPGSGRDLICIYQSFFDWWPEYRLMSNELSIAHEQMRNDKTSFHRLYHVRVGFLLKSTPVRMVNAGSPDSHCWSLHHWHITN